MEEKSQVTVDPKVKKLPKAKKKSSEKAVKPKKAEKKGSKKQMNAVQKLEAVESMILGHQQQIGILADELDKVSQVVQVLATRLNASNQVANIAPESVDKIIIDENIKQLELQVKDLVDKKVIEKSKDGEISSENCFVVAREIDKDGNEVAKRIQFAVMTLVPELRPRFIGQKEGSVVKNDFNENSIEIVEVYDVIPPKKDIKFKEGDVDQKK